jgi:hypothetical protein
VVGCCECSDEPSGSGATELKQLTLTCCSVHGWSYSIVWILCVRFITNIIVRLTNDVHFECV